MKNNKGKGNIRTIIAVVLLIIIVGALIFTLKGCGGFEFGTGSSKGNNESSAKDNNDSVNNTTEEAVTVAQDDKEDNAEEDYTENGEIVIKILEDKVYFEDTLVKDKDELKNKLEETSNDKVTYHLVEDNPILGTYNWVTETMEELKIEYLKTETIVD